MSRHMPSCFLLVALLVTLAAVSPRPVAAAPKPVCIDISWNTLARSGKTYGTGTWGLLKSTTGSGLAPGKDIMLSVPSNLAYPATPVSDLAFNPQVGSVPPGYTPPTVSQTGVRDGDYEPASPAGCVCQHFGRNQEQAGASFVGLQDGRLGHLAKHQRKPQPPKQHPAALIPVPLLLRMGSCCARCSRGSGAAGVCMADGLQCMGLKWGYVRLQAVLINLLHSGMVKD